MGSSISGGRGSRFLFPILIPLRHVVVFGVNGIALGNVVLWSRQVPSYSETGHLSMQQRVRIGE
jgi:hypothetical protein